MHDKNTKEHSKNTVNRKELPQLSTNISATSLTLKQNSKQKVFDKQDSRQDKDRQRVSRQRQKSFHLFPSKTFIQVIYVYTVIKPCQI